MNRKFKTYGVSTAALYCDFSKCFLSLYALSLYSVTTEVIGLVDRKFSVDTSASDSLLVLEEWKEILVVNCPSSKIPRFTNFFVWNHIQ